MAWPLHNFSFIPPFPHLKLPAKADSPYDSNIIIHVIKIQFRGYRKSGKFNLV